MKTRFIAAALFTAALSIACSKEAPVEATPPTPPAPTEVVAPVPAAADETAKEADDLAKEIEADLADEG